MPVAIEAKPVKARESSFAKIRPRAAVALDAQGGAGSIRIVVVAGEAIDRAVLFVREIERQPARAQKGGLAERGIHRCGQKGCERDGAGDHGTHDESRMPPERQHRARRCLP